MDHNLIEDAKRGGYISEIMRRLGSLERDTRSLFSKLGGAKTYKDILGANAGWGTIPAGSSRYIAPFMSAFSTNASRLNSPFAGTLKNFRMRINTAQPASGNLVATLYVAGVATSIVITVPAGAAAGGIYGDLTNTAAVGAGSGIFWYVTNNALAASAQIDGLTIEFEIPLS